MLISIISFVLALAMGIYSQAYEVQIDVTILGALVAFIGAAFCILQPLLQVLVLSSLQKNEQNVIPHTLESYHHDRGLRVSRVILYLFVFFSFAIAVALLAINVRQPVWLFAAWIFALGVALDVLRDQISRTTMIVNPYTALEKLTNRARHAIQSNNQEKFLSTLDALCEVSTNAIQRGKLTLCNEALDGFGTIMGSFFKSVKAIGHGLATDGKDRIGYTVFFLIQRITLIFDMSLRYGYELICQHVITVLGKIINAAAHCDLSLITYPTQALGALAHKAQNAHMHAVVTTATSTLIEVTRSIVNEVDLTYLELVEPFQSIILALDNIAKQKFKKDKSINLKVLQEPFVQIKEIFRNPKIANHRDTPIVIRDIDGILAEYAALEQVMLTVPPPK